MIVSETSKINTFIEKLGGYVFLIFVRYSVYMYSLETCMKLYDILFKYSTDVSLMINKFNNKK